MKKLLALILAAALALSLVACGGGSGTGDNKTPSTGNGDTTSTDTPSGGMTKEEMLANAQRVSLADLFADFNENKVKAEETYIGNTFSVFGYVYEIESEYCELGYINTVGSGRLRVYLDKEELIELDKGEVIHIVGIIGDFEKEESKGYNMPPTDDIINMKTAYYIDNFTSGVLIVDKFITKDEGKFCIAKQVQMLSGIEDEYMNYRILFDEETMSTLKEQDFILVSGTAYDGGGIIELHNPELLVKGQDEITAYFEQMDNELNK